MQEQESFNKTSKDHIQYAHMISKMFETYLISLDAYQFLYDFIRLKITDKATFIVFTNAAYSKAPLNVFLAGGDFTDDLKPTTITRDEELYNRFLKTLLLELESFGRERDYIKVYAPNQHDPRLRDLEDKLSFVLAMKVSSTKDYQLRISLLCNGLGVLAHEVQSYIARKDVCVQTGFMSDVYEQWIRKSGLVVCTDLLEHHANKHYCYLKELYVKHYLLGAAASGITNQIKKLIDVYRLRIKQEYPSFHLHSHTESVVEEDFRLIYKES